MPVETAADLASFFEMEEFAEAAVYAAPESEDPALGCTVVIDRGQGRERFDAGDMEATTAERRLTVRRAELATVARGGRFDLVDEDGAPTGEAYLVMGLPQLEETGHVWLVDLAIVE